MYNTFGFLLIQPILINYFEQLGMQRVANPSEEEIELIVLVKEDILLKKINFERTSSREFRLNESWFDIVKEVEHDSLVYFYCISDKKEDALEKEFQKRVDENSANKKQRLNDSSLFKTLTTEPVCYLTPAPMNSVHSNYISYKRGIYNQVLGDVPTPPPKSFLSA